MANIYPQIIYSNRIGSILALPPEPKQEKIKPVLYPVVIFALFINVIWIWGTIKLFREGYFFWGTIQSIINISILFFVIAGIITIYDSIGGYKVKHRKWEKQIAELKANETKREYREKQIETYLNSREPVDIDNCNGNDIVKKGICEMWFYEKIKDTIEKMGGFVSLNKKIVIYKDFSYTDYSIYKDYITYGFIDRKLINPNVLDAKYYYPDIIVGISNIFLDIEIDEPYTMDGRLPVHCIGSDDYRNDYFSFHGWEIIRFSEKQIVNYPEKCIATITNTIKYIIEGKCESPIVYNNGDWIMSRWDESSARLMAKSNYRESYLYDNKGNLKVNQ